MCVIDGDKYELIGNYWIDSQRVMIQSKRDMTGLKRVMNQLRVRTRLEVSLLLQGLSCLF